MANFTLTDYFPRSRLSGLSIGVMESIPNIVYCALSHDSLELCTGDDIICRSIISEGDTEGVFIASYDDEREGVKDPGMYRSSLWICHGQCRFYRRIDARPYGYVELNWFKPSTCFCWNRGYVRHFRDKLIYQIPSPSITVQELPSNTIALQTKNRIPTLNGKNSET